MPKKVINTQSNLRFDQDERSDSIARRRKKNRKNVWFERDGQTHQWLTTTRLGRDAPSTDDAECRRPSVTDYGNVNK